MSDGERDDIESFLAEHDPFEKAPSIHSGDKIGDWRVTAFLGRGAASEVYRAENIVTRQIGAIKVQMRGDDKAHERFRREVLLLADAACDALPRFYGAGEHDGRVFFAMELLTPTDLPSSDAAVAKFMLGVCAGVEALHARGYVHRDIKPLNVMRRPSTGEPVLIDMGLAKESFESQKTISDTLSVVDGHAVGVGTVGYSAPEQFTGGKISAAADVHALGMLANACFNSHPPREWAEIIRRSTSSAPEQRFVTVEDFMRAIRHRHWLRWCVAGVALAVLGITIGTVLAVRMKIAELESETPKQDSEEQRLAEALLNSTYDAFYSGDTNIDKKAAIELMRKGQLPSF